MSHEFVHKLEPLPKGWAYQPLQDCTVDKVISYGIVQPGAHLEDGIPIVRVNNFREGELLLDDVKRVSPDIESSYSRTRLKGGEVLLTLVGSIGQAAIVPEDLSGWNVARAVCVIRPEQEIGAEWLYLCLHSPQVQRILQKVANTTVQATVNLKDVRQLPIPVPPKDERNKITKIIRSLERRIKLNRRMNATLEAMVRALFKAWFVDFEPVHANNENRPSTSASGEIAKLFPSAFENGIPQGWRPSTIGEEAQVVGGSTPSTKEPSYWNGNHAWVTPKDLSNVQDKVLIRSDRTITPEGLATISSGELPKNTVLLSSRAPVGYLALTKIPVSINQGFIAMKCNGSLSPSYVLQWAEHSMDAIKTRASGTTFAEISKANFRPLPVVVPSEAVIASFESIAGKFYELIALNARESEVLASLRDELLPRLISGKLRVKI